MVCSGTWHCERSFFTSTRICRCQSCCYGFERCQQLYVLIWAEIIYERCGPVFSLLPHLIHVFWVSCHIKLFICWSVPCFSSRNSPWCVLTLFQCRYVQYGPGSWITFSFSGCCLPQLLSWAHHQHSYSTGLSWILGNSGSLLSLLAHLAAEP